MLILNPTPIVIVARHDGASYVFKSNERKEIFNQYAAKHILNTWGKMGLVDITYNDKVAKKYPDHEMYVFDQTSAGLNACYEYHLDIDQNFDVYDQEWGDRKHPYRFKAKRNRDELKKTLDIVEKALADFAKIDVKVLMKDKADQLMKQAESLMKEAERLNNGDDTKKPSGQLADRGKRP